MLVLWQESLIAIAHIVFRLMLIRECAFRCLGKVIPKVVRIPPTCVKAHLILVEGGECFGKASGNIP